MSDNDLHTGGMSLTPVSERVDDDSLKAVLDFVRSCQLEDGGFCGRSGESDLYYSFFAAAILNDMGGFFDRDRFEAYLYSFGNGTELDFIHLACLIRCRAITGNTDSIMLGRQLELFEKYRSDDGGYHQLDKGSATGSVYACFIAWLVYMDVGKEVPDREGLISCIKSFKLDDGTYANDATIGSGTTAVTAAAVVMLHGLGLSVGDDVILSLASRAVDGGGFLAGETVPIPDLLSTGTALYALGVVGYDFGNRIDMCYEYVASLWNEDGGFAGNKMDEMSDCEYTYYALLALGKRHIDT